MEELAALILTLLTGMIIGAMLGFTTSFPKQVEAGYGYEWKCKGHQIAKVKDIYVDVKPCERVKK